MPKPAVIIGAGVFAIGVAVTVTLTACQSAKPPVDFVADFDGSGSSRRLLPQGASCFVRSISDSECRRLMLFRHDRACQPFFDGPAPDGPNRLLRTLRAELSRPAKRAGTVASTFWTPASEIAASVNGACIVVSIGDGDDDAQSDAEIARMRAAGRRLASNPRCVVAIEGDPANWARMRSEFSPMGDRLLLCAPADMSRDFIDRAVNMCENLTGGKNHG